MITEDAKSFVEEYMKVHQSDDTEKNSSASKPHDNAIEQE